MLYLCKKRTKMKSDYQQQVINRIRVLRESKGVTQLALANMLGISPGQMGNIDSCKQPHKYTIKQIMTICDTLGIGIEYVLFPDDQSSKVYSVRDVVYAIIRYQESSK